MGKKCRHARKKKSSQPQSNVKSRSTEAEECGDDVFDFGNEEVPFHEGVRRLFLGASTVMQHLEAQNKNAIRYAATLAVLEESGVTLSQSSRPRAVAAAFARADNDLTSSLLLLPEEKLSVKEVVKAISLLDSRRAAKCNAKALKRLEANSCKKKKKLAILKSVIASLEVTIATEGMQKGSVNRRVAGHVKKWIKRIPAERFIFYASHFPTEPWKRLADVCHLHPTKDFPQCPWFLNFCYGESPPDDSVVKKSADLSSASDIVSLVMESEIDYSVVRQHTTKLPDKAKERIASYTSNLDTIIWYYEELCCSEVDDIILKRLQGGTQLNMAYGKLMERLLMLNLKKKEGRELMFLNLMLEQADERLRKICLQLEEPVAVIGDRSRSMEVAIRTSNIIGSLLAVASHAELTFFDSELSHPPFIPETAPQVIELSDIIYTRNLTRPAIALLPYYNEKKIIRTFIIVTDEEENGSVDGQSFAQLFLKYHNEVYPASLVFVSFLCSQTEQGQMVTELKKLDSSIKVKQFRFNGRRPDLTKLDSMLALLSFNMAAFTGAVESKELELLENKTANCLNVNSSQCCVL